MRVLVIEDEKKLAAYIKKGLEENHFAVDVSYDGEEGLFTLTSSEYDLVILDILLPGKKRLEIIEEVWDYSFDSIANVIDVFVNRLRNKIDRDRTQKLIHTIKGVGYIMKEGE